MSDRPLQAGDMVRYRWGVRNSGAVTEYVGFARAVPGDDGLYVGPHRLDDQRVTAIERLVPVSEMDAAVAAEREACAEVCDVVGDRYWIDCAAEIRRRGTDG